MKNTISILLTAITCLNAWSQDLYNNGALISIKANTIFSAGSSFNNRGTVTNNGSLNVTGTWMNNGTYNEADGEVTFNNPESQIISHNSQSFTRLNVAGGGIKIFEEDLTVKEELVLESGVLQAANDAMLIIEPDAQVNAGFNGSYVDGTIVHRGTGNKLFPVGIGNRYLPVELLDVTGVDPEIAFQVFSPNPNTSFDGSLNGISDSQYWQLDVLSGSFDGSQIQLGVNNESSFPDIQSTVVAQASDLESSFTSLGSSEFNGDIFDGSVTSDAIGTGPIFTVGFAPEVSADASITVINALSPNGDGVHDFLKVMNITAFPNNVVTIFNRWGDRVFETKGYDNVNSVFEGFANINGSDELIDGTYFYVIDKGNGDKTKSGFIEIRR